MASSLGACAAKVGVWKRANNFPHVAEVANMVLFAVVFLEEQRFDQILPVPSEFCPSTNETTREVRSCFSDPPLRREWHVVVVMRWPLALCQDI